MEKIKKRPLTPEEKLLRGYQRKLTFEAIIKSLVLALIAGFMLCILVSIISFATKFNALWISLGVWVAATAGLSVLFYFKIFRTTLDKTASRVDGMGLDERVITMIEFAGSDNVIAQAQRRDTAEILQSVTPKHMKFAKTKIFIILVSCLAAIAITAILMMSFSTVQAVAYEQEQEQLRQEEEEGKKNPVLSEEDQIIKDMLEDLRKIIADAKIQESLRNKLYGMVDDLEASLKPDDSREVKIAKISTTSQEIHKILQDTIPYQLQQHETTEKFGKDIDTDDFDKIEKAFKDMYDSIPVLAEQQKYAQMEQTAKDILQSIDDAQAVDEDLAEALEKLAKAFLAAIPPPPDGSGEEDKTNDEVDWDEIQDALDAMKDNKDEIDQLDKDIQDVFNNALENLGQETPDPEEEEEENKDEESGDSDNSSTPPNGGDSDENCVIDGKTPYVDVYDEYEEEALKQLLANGNLTDEQRQIIENYINLLKQNKGDNNG